MILCRINYTTSSYPLRMSRRFNFSVIYSKQTQIHTFSQYAILCFLCMNHHRPHRDNGGHQRRRCRKLLRGTNRLTYRIHREHNGTPIRITIRRISRHTRPINPINHSNSNTNKIIESIPHTNNTRHTRITGRINGRPITIRHSVVIINGIGRITGINIGTGIGVLCCITNVVTDFTHPSMVIIIHAQIN
jgi:hypothetical protein